MAPRILPEHGFDPSCGNFMVKVADKQFDSTSIQVHYDRFIDSDHTHHRASLPWSGARISVADAEALLDSASVPFFIKFASAIDMLLKFVDQTLKQTKPGDCSTRLPSILVKISSDLETTDGFDQEEES